jgi:tetratricopeptide (TPR) repeat protein
MASLAALNAELPNLLAVLAWALDHRPAEVFLQILGDLGEYWWYSGRWQEGLPWFDAALDPALTVSDHGRATALLYRGRLTDAHLSYQRHHDDLELSLVLFRACEDPAGMAACLGHLAWDAAWRGRFDQAEALATEAAQVAQRAGDERVVALALSIGALVASGYDDLAPRATAAVAHLRAVGDLIGLVRICGNVGYAATVERRYDDALSWLEKGLEFARPLGDPAALFFIRTNQGLASLFDDDLDEARQAFCEALTACRDGAEDVADETLLGLAAVEAWQGDLERAAHLAGAAQSRETANRSVDEDTIWDRLYDEILTPARERYGTENWDRAAGAAAVLSLPEAIDLALAQGPLALLQ